MIDTDFNKVSEDYLIDSGVLAAMLDNLDAGRNLGQYYSMAEAEKKLAVAENPFDTLELLGCIQYEEDRETKLCLYSSDRQLLGLELSFQGDKLAGAVYSCGVPDNLRSRAIGWVNRLIH